MARSEREKRDPTHQAANRARAIKASDARLSAAQSRIIMLFNRIQVSRGTETVIVNQTKTVYEYNITPEQLNQLVADVRKILNDELLDTQAEDPPADWWWRPEVEPPHRSGYQSELIGFNQLIAAAAIAGHKNKFGNTPQKIPPEIALSSPAYNASLSNVYASGWQSYKNLSDTTATAVNRVINNGIQAGLSKSEIADQIAERFNVAKNNAKRIADTEVNSAYNNARMSATKAAAEQSGMSAGVVHVSALLPVTRRTHAERHGNAYTVADQTAWWDTDANRINCYCSVRSVLLDSEGNVISKKLQNDLKAEKE